MTDNRGFSSIGSILPDMMDFVSVLVRDYRSGDIDSWEALDERVRSFFTPDAMARVEAVAPRWGDMARYADGVTLVHVVAVFVSLFLCPEFRRASRTRQELLKWIVFFHDIAKASGKEWKDHTHGFRSAAMAAAALPGIGFEVSPAYNDLINDWVKLTGDAVTVPPGMSVRIQDNRRLPDILDGVERLFGSDTPPSLIVRTVLFHMSLDVVADWPQEAPLSDSEVRKYLDASLLPLLRVMMLVDNDGWAPFDKAVRRRYRRETLAVFRRLESLLST